MAFLAWCGFLFSILYSRLHLHSQQIKIPICQRHFKFTCLCLVHVLTFIRGLALIHEGLILNWEHEKRGSCLLRKHSMFQTSKKWLINNCKKERTEWESHGQNELLIGKLYVLIVWAVYMHIHITSTGLVFEFCYQKLRNGADCKVWFPAAPQWNDPRRMKAVMTFRILLNTSHVGKDYTD